MYEGQFSPVLNLALFSAALAAPQPDWPQNTVVTGFPLYDREVSGQAMPQELTEFLDSGPPPVVFTLGSTAVMAAGPFYTESIEAVRRLGRRAVLLIGRDPRNVPQGSLPRGVMACDYAPYSELFPRAAAIVHQGGIGTTAQAMRAGRPMVVVPYGFDQPDNGARVARLGIGKVIQRKAYCAERAAAVLSELLADDAYSRKAETVGARVRSEDGAGAACDAIERVSGAGRRE
jgi:UDP:flavonoid glycosyltransferase YjiC (YdhE family)